MTPLSRSIIARVAVLEALHRTHRAAVQGGPSPYANLTDVFALCNGWRADAGLPAWTLPPDETPRPATRGSDLPFATRVVASLRAALDLAYGDGTA
jgi:hypothetical protein